MSATSSKEGKKPPCPHKKTDFRYELWVKERKNLRKKAKSKSFKVVPFSQPKRPSVTVDTSKARSNLDLVRTCLKELRWREFPFGRRDGQPCDIYWHGVFYSEGHEEVPGGKVNKFPGMIEVLRKVALTRTLEMMHRLFPEDYQFCPRTWLLPEEYGDFAKTVRKAAQKDSKAVYIVKPDEGSQGEGIYLIRDPSEYIMPPPGKRHVVQQYLDSPLLVDDLKFDFRIYVLVAGLDPPEVYISREGLARFCTVPYEPPNQKNLHETFMHLTNYSLNKRSSGYVHTESQEDGSKRTLSSVLDKLQHSGYDTQRIWDDIERLVVKTILAIVPELKLEYRAEVPQGKQGPSCFQILGFDILLQSDCRPYLLEVNANPSLRIDYEHEIAPGISEYLYSPVDEEIKKPVVKQALIIAAPKAKLARRKSAHHRKNQDSLDSEGNSDTENELAGNMESEEVLIEILPRKYGDLYAPMRLMERAVAIFMACLGVRGTLTMGSTAFRTFTRKCKLTASGFTNAAIDILFIELQKRWEPVTQDRGHSGLCYQGFLEAFFLIARKKFQASHLLDSIESLIDYCESNLEFSSNDTRGRHPKLPVMSVISQKEMRIDQMDSAYGHPRRRTKGSDYFLDYTKFTVEQKGARRIKPAPKVAPSGKSKATEAEHN